MILMDNSNKKVMAEERIDETKTDIKHSGYLSLILLTASICRWFSATEEGTIKYNLFYFTV